MVSMLLSLLPVLVFSAAPPASVPLVQPQAPLQGKAAPMRGQASAPMSTSAFAFTDRSALRLRGQESRLPMGSAWKDSQASLKEVPDETSAAPSTAAMYHNAEHLALANVANGMQMSYATASGSGISQTVIGVLMLLAATVAMTIHFWRHTGPQSLSRIEVTEMTTMDYAREEWPDNDGVSLTVTSGESIQKPCVAKQSEGTAFAPSSKVSMLTIENMMSAEIGMFSDNIKICFAPNGDLALWANPSTPIDCDEILISAWNDMIAGLNIKTSISSSPFFGELGLGDEGYCRAKFVVASFGSECSSQFESLKRESKVSRYAEEEDKVGRRNYLIENLTSPLPYGIPTWALLSFTLWSLTREEKIRKAKVCVRSKEFIDDYMADPKKTAFLASKGIPYENMRQYLQGDDCLDFAVWVEKLKNSKAFWEVGEEYNVGG